MPARLARVCLRTCYDAEAKRSVGFPQHTRVDSQLMAWWAAQARLTESPQCFCKYTPTRVKTTSTIPAIKRYRPISVPSSENSSVHSVDPRFATCLSPPQPPAAPAAMDKIRDNHREKAGRRRSDRRSGFRVCLKTGIYLEQIREFLR